MNALLKKAGLSTIDFARILGISRVTVHNWRAGKSSPHHLLEPRVKRALTIITKLHDMGRLPLPLKGEERRQAIAKIHARVVG